MKVWDTLQHRGPWFPPSYVYQNIPFKYNNKVYKLSSVAEHLALLYSLTPEKNKDHVFNTNFFKSWKGFVHKDIKYLCKCDFSAFDRASLQKQKCPKTYKYCTVNGKNVCIDNPVVEPTCLFSGRGNHPLRGTAKFQVSPDNVTVNGTAVCPPLHGAWGGVVCNKDVAWLASYKDSMGVQKYVFASEMVNNDVTKFDNAKRLSRKLPLLNERAYVLLKSSATRDKRIGAAMLLLIRLGIRVGHEHDGDTMGCCTLEAQCFTFHTRRRITLSFCGKDSIPYNRTFVCDQLLYDTLKTLCTNRHVFKDVRAHSVNAEIKRIVPFATAKTIRTAIASKTLYRLLCKGSTLQHLKESIQKVAKLCNHVKATTLSNKFVLSTETAKSHYIDPRIVFSFCKRNNVDISKVYNDGLCNKHKWASSASDYVF